MIIRHVVALFAVIIPVAAHANENISFTSDVFIEKQSVTSTGRTRLTLAEPKHLAPGDRLVFVVKYQNKSRYPATNFVVTNPLPDSVSYQSSVGQNATVSVDGGRNWGQLSTLKIKDGNKIRYASAADVTHIRWNFNKPIPAGSTGKLLFRGIVR